MDYDDGGFLRRETQCDLSWPKCVNCDNDVAAGTRYCFECEAELEEMEGERFSEARGEDR